MYPKPILRSKVQLKPIWNMRDQQKFNRKCKVRKKNHIHLKKNLAPK